MLWTMSAPIRHHYLPVFYLVRWAGEDGKVCRFHRPFREVVVSRRIPDNTGYEDRLYSLEGAPAGQEQRIETEVMNALVNSPAAPVLEKLIARGPAQLSNPEKSDLLRFFMSLQLRGPFALQELKTLALRNVRANLHRLSDAEYEAIKREGDPPTVWDWAVENLKGFEADTHKHFLPGLIDHQGIGQHVMLMTWAVVDCADDGATLLTCDRPWTTTHGLGDARCTLAIPLSPTKLFLATNLPQTMERLLSVPRRQLVRSVNVNIVGVAVETSSGDAPRHRRFVEKRLVKRGEAPIPGMSAR